MAASRTMSPSRASTGEDCTTLKEAKLTGGGEHLRPPCARSLDHPAGSPPTTEQSTSSPPPSRNGIALPYLRALTPEEKWTCPSAVCQLTGLCGKMDPGAGWASGASRGCSSGLRSVLAAKKTSTLNGRFLLPRPVSRRDEMAGHEDPSSPPPTLASGTAPESSGIPSAREPYGSEATGPATSTFLSHARSRPRLATQGRGFAHRVLAS